MAARISCLIAFVLALFIALPTQASIFTSNGNSRFVPVEQAFAFDFSQQGHQLTLSWKVKEGYYLYRQQIHVSARQAQIAPVALPPGQPHEDEFYGKSEIYPQDLRVPVQLQQAASGASLVVTYQGCAAAGFCYPPETRTIPLTPVAADAAPSAVSASPAPATPLPFSPLWALLIGIGVAFTPCVLPMYPLIAGIILGGQRSGSLLRLFSLALVYVLGMALTYTLLGVVVAAAGLRFQAALQHPYVLIGLSLIFTLLALSMFGLFQLQLPASVQTRLTLWSNRQQGGSLPGVFLMGALAGLICSPCTTAPLSAILLYIAQSGNLWAGAGTLWLYAMGMGLPLIAVTVFGNRLLPKSGPWMQTVKQGFGFVILALPVFLLERVLGDLWGARLWSALGVAGFAWAFCSSLRGHGGKWRILQMVMLAAALISARPLQEWVWNAPAASQTAAQLPFQRIASAPQLDEALRQANGRVTMVDLYADWCVACKEFEKYTFSDPGVREALSHFQLLQANVTANNATDNALLQHLQVLGLPTILFFDAQGREIPDSRVTGFLNAEDFRAHLQNRTR
ncbi:MULTISPECIES: protein-disulfide reductase DsbD [Pantoea]|jgi:thiol:disulfide interchange protein DsbD|uniref:protein-disulfide reductase DsbD n=1 Tax=Pantoea TaxID=53335 RepID=UPI000EA14E86|nr:MULTISPECIES: protein-disulfide reductase DsbD [Pantoea]MBZ6387340.1 protein-disulfide reductase DsbD [Pantoea piersonii]MBZ6399756.1 protein-disulfide reductase DsbD [Pantoea piersonii]MBZ6406824.1 protein-disulfide reductase DsbD [Pantoea piersonii]MBZ6425704.1 protein-disulfide reductase DsbD [Pantoea piersonii]NYB02921.1 protein-disulfide reductase DsbD [Pantoea piersonii]